MKVQFIVSVATVLLSAVPSAFAAKVSSSLIHDTSLHRHRRCCWWLFCRACCSTSSALLYKVLTPLPLPSAASSSHPQPVLRGVNVPEFFPTSMNKDDAELYLSHHKKKEEEISPIIEVNKNDWLSQCGGTFKNYVNHDSLSKSNFYLINEPSGLCADFFACAFDKCMVDNTDSITCLGQADPSSAEYDDVASTCNLPTSSLPGSIMFPKNAADGKYTCLLI